jgi:uncharacterized repeat protein (TIGR03803 family)
MKTGIGRILFLIGALAFLMAPEARAGVTCTWLYAIDGHSDATLVQDSKGTLYGTTIGPEVKITGTLGAYTYGTLFEASTNGPSETYFPLERVPGLTNIWIFPNDDDSLLSGLGGEPNAGVILGPSESLIGTTAFYGNSNTLFPTGMGCVYGFFTNRPPPSPRYYHFGGVLNSHGQPLDGASPRSTLAAASNNYLYGTTYEGGSNGYSSGGLGYGTVFKLNTNGFALTSLHSFAGTDGANPTGLTFGSDGNLYGVASFGGSNTAVVETNGKTGFGAIYKITTNGALTVLYSFGTMTNLAGNALDGSQPNPLLQGTDGNFYGTTAFGGSNTTIVDSSQDVGYGTFFQISTNGAFIPLYSFGSVTNSAGVPLDGANPSGPLVEGLDGNFYGVTQFGGPTNTGTIFRMTPQGTLTTLYTFGTNSGIRDPGDPLDPYAPAQTGEYPRGGLIIAADGSFYGTTYTGGPEAGDTGAIFRLGPSVPRLSNAPVNITIPAGATNIYSAQVYSIYETACQWQFDGINLADGGNISGSATPTLTISGATTADSGTYTLVASNVAGSASLSGELTVVPAVILEQPAGATIVAGASNTFSVSVNSILPPGFQWQFDGTNLSDGGNISGSATSNLTISGATMADTGMYSVVISNSAGTVQSAGTSLLVIPFLVPSPPASLALLAGASGTFTEDIESDLPMSYQWQLDGTNLSDGPDFSGSETSNLTVTATMADAGTYAVVATNADGGVTNFATLTVTPFTVITPPTSALALAGGSASFALVVQSVYPMSYQWGFNGANLSDSDHIAGSATATLTINNAGPSDAGTYTVAATNAAGSTNFNVVLTVVAPLSCGTTLSNVYSFTGGDDGANPEAALLQASDGSFYGTAYNGGAYGQGAVFQFSTNGSFVPLYSFGANITGLDGYGPASALVQGNNGNLYGTTEMGGSAYPDDFGTIYEVTLGGTLYDLDAFGSDYGPPLAGLVLDTNGYFYGATADYGVFQMASDGTLTTFYVLPWFPGCQNTLLIGADGNFYGVVGNNGAYGYGWVFCLVTNVGFANLYSFTGGADGANPGVPLIQGSDGALYGSTPSGGASGFGTVFRLTTNGTFSVLYSFGAVTNWDGSAQDGAQANGLLLGNDGNFYGTTASGGYNGDGTIFRLTPGGALTTLAFFDGTNGANPEAALVQGTDGYYYGTTANGGSNNAGTVFRMSVSPGLTAVSQSNGMISFCCSALAGQTYQVQYTSSLSPPNWLNLGSPILATGPGLNFTDAFTNCQGFYRIVQISRQ